MSNMEKLEKVLEGYKVGELKELAKTAGITGYSKLKKAELVDVMKEELTKLDASSYDFPEEIQEVLSGSESDEVVTTEETSNQKDETSVSPKNSLRKESFVMGTRTITKSKKIYPNDPCPCGSGKKYKKCCGR